MRRQIVQTHFVAVKTEAQQAQGMLFRSVNCLDDYGLRAPWKGALSLRVRIPPGSCRSSR